jgi:predicted RNA-binding protein Jag
MPEEIRQSLIKIVKKLTFPIAGEIQIDLKKEGSQWRVNLITQKGKSLIGTNSQTLKSLQHLVRVLIHNLYPQDRTHFLLDVNNLKKKKENVLVRTIPSMAKKKVLEQGNTLIMTGLTGYERLTVHQVLRDVSGLETTSVGDTTNRKLIIRPTSDTGATGIENSEILHIGDLLKNEANK